MIENLRQMEMRAGASRLVVSTFSSDVKSSIAGVAHSPTQLPPTPDPGALFHGEQEIECQRQNCQDFEIKEEIIQKRRAWVPRRRQLTRYATLLAPQTPLRYSRSRRQFAVEKSQALSC
jgi:hypothetical protein